MKGPVRGGGALAALLAAGGLYAWRNRDKIQGWVNSQRSSSNQSTQSYTHNESITQMGHTQPSGLGSYPVTGATQRISDVDAPIDSTDVQNDPYAAGI